MATIYQSKFTGSQIDGGIEKVTDHENRIITLENKSENTVNSVTYELVDDNGTLKLVGSDGSVSDIVYGTVSLEEYCQFTQTNSQNIEKLGSRVSALEETSGSGESSSISFTQEEIIIESSSWTSLSDKAPYTYYATLTLSNSLDNATSLELINNNPVLFSTYGFAIGEIVNSNVIIVYSIGQPSASVTLTLEMIIQAGSVSLISFTIEGTSYQAEEGMTWRQWTESKYNSSGYTSSSSAVVCPEGGFNYLAAPNGNFVDSDDAIIANTDYKHKLMD